MPIVNGWDVTWGRAVVSIGNVRKLQHSAHLVPISDNAKYSGCTPWALRITSEQDGRRVQTMTLLSDTKSKLSLDVRLATETK